MEIPIKPSHIDTTRHFFDAFGHCETEVSAQLLCKFMQEQGDAWKLFTLAELRSRYGPNFVLNKLVEDNKGLLVKNGNVYEVTAKFVGTCYAASPAK